MPLIMPLNQINRASLSFRMQVLEQVSALGFVNFPI
jgi:hypothetical protein